MKNFLNWPGVIGLVVNVILFYLGLIIINPLINLIMPNFDQIWVPESGIAEETILVTLLLLFILNVVFEVKYKPRFFFIPLIFFVFFGFDLALFEICNEFYALIFAFICIFSCIVILIRKKMIQRIQEQTLAA